MTLTTVMTKVGATIIVKVIAIIIATIMTITTTIDRRIFGVSYL